MANLFWFSPSVCFIITQAGWVEIRSVSLRSLLYLSSHESVCFPEMSGVDFSSSISSVLRYLVLLTPKHTYCIYTQEGEGYLSTVRAYIKKVLACLQML